MRPVAKGEELVPNNLALAQPRSGLWPYHLVADLVEARNRAVVRCGAIAEIEHDLVDVTPPPAFGRVIAFE